METLDKTGRMEEYRLRLQIRHMEANSDSSQLGIFRADREELLV